MQPDVDSIHELFVGVEALGSQPDLIPWWRDGNRLVPGPDCKEGGRKSPSWRAWLKHLCELQRGPVPFFGINLHSLFSVSQ